MLDLMHDGRILLQVVSVRGGVVHPRRPSAAASAVAVVVAARRAVRMLRRHLRTAAPVGQEGAALPDDLLKFFSQVTASKPAKPAKVRKINNLEKKRRQDALRDALEKFQYRLHSQFARHRVHQPLDVVGVRRVPRELHLRPLLIQLPAEILQGQESHSVRVLQVKVPTLASLNNCRVADCPRPTLVYSQVRHGGGARARRSLEVVRMVWRRLAVVTVGQHPVPRPRSRRLRVRLSGRGRRDHCLLRLMQRLLRRGRRRGREERGQVQLIDGPGGRLLQVDPGCGGRRRCARVVNLVEGRRLESGLRRLLLVGRGRPADHGHGRLVGRGGRRVRRE